MPADDALPLSRGEARRAGLTVPPASDWVMPRLPDAQSVALDSWSQIMERAVAATPPGQPVASPVAAGTVVTFRTTPVLDREMVQQNRDGHLGFPDPPPEEVKAKGSVSTTVIEGDHVADLAVAPMAVEPRESRPFRRT